MKVLVLSVPGLRLDALGLYGNDWIDTPHLDGLATESVVFDQYFAGGADPASTFRSWSTGCHDFTSICDRAPSDPHHSILPPELAAADVETWFIGALERQTAPQFVQGFQHARHAPDSTSLWTAARKSFAVLRRRARALLWIDLPHLLPPWDLAGDALEAYIPDAAAPDDGDPPLSPWVGVPPATVAPEDETTLLRLQRTYAAAVTAFDAELGRFLKTFRENKAKDDWLLVLTAPFGLPLGDHGIVGLSRPWLHEELVHLPLVLRLPQGAEAGRRIDALTQTIDLAATICDFFNLPDSGQEGRSLLPLCRGEATTERTEIIHALQTANAEEWSLRTREWAFLLPAKVPVGNPPRSPQLFVKPDDRHEVNNVLQHNLELAEQLERKLRAAMCPTSV
jgi:arylsulfatase A-like enzyme